MLRLAGIPVPVEDTGWIIAQLYREARSDAMSLAIRLKRALDRDTAVLALNRPERHVILSVLDDPPDSLLELRGVLMREATTGAAPEVEGQVDAGDPRLS